MHGFLCRVSLDANAGVSVGVGASLAGVVPSAAAPGADVARSAAVDGKV